MSALVLAVLVAAIAIGGVVRGQLTMDGQFLFVCIALGALAALIGTATLLASLADHEPVRWERLVGERHR